MLSSRLSNSSCVTASSSARALRCRVYQQKSLFSSAATCTGTGLVQYCSEDDWRSPLSTTADPAYIALGKFDALHLGHRSLVTQAAGMGGQPWLLSFSGMAQVMGWTHRPPLVAPCSRSAVLQAWQPHCRGHVPLQRFIPFQQVRSMSPADFVLALAEDLQVSGIVVGEGYRFGYKAQGDTDMLAALCDKHRLKLHVATLLASSTEPGSSVSSSKVRAALSEGNVAAVRRYLGRPYSLVAHVPAQSLPLPPYSVVRLPLACLQNQPPAYGMYSARVVSADGAGAQPDVTLRISDRGIHMPIGEHLSREVAAPYMHLDIQIHDRLSP